MIQTRHDAKRQKIEDCTSCMESVMFNSDSLFKIASYLPADGLLNLALTCKRFGIEPVSDDDSNGSLSLVEDTARRIVHDVATEEQLNALPRYDEDNWLCKYNYLQSLRAPLTFDQLVGRESQYVEGNKSRVASPTSGLMTTAFSNNIMMAGKHYASFEVSDGTGLLLGVMRPGEAKHNTEGTPLAANFHNNFTQRTGSRQYNNSVNCCMYGALNGHRYSHDWGEGNFVVEEWDEMEGLLSPYKAGMLLDLDEGTLSVYKNGRKLGVMKRGLAGHYCWAVSLAGGSQVTIKRGIVPAS